MNNGKFEENGLLSVIDIEPQLTMKKFGIILQVLIALAIVLPTNPGFYACSPAVSVPVAFRLSSQNPHLKNWAGTPTRCRQEQNSNSHMDQTKHRRPSSRVISERNGLFQSQNLTYFRIPSGTFPRFDARPPLTHPPA